MSASERKIEALEDEIRRLTARNAKYIEHVVMDVGRSLVRVREMLEATQGDLPKDFPTQDLREVIGVMRDMQEELEARVVNHGHAKDARL